MAGRSKLPALVLTPEEQKRLETLQASRVAPVREAERARILLQYRAGNSPSAIQQALGLSRVTIYRCLHKALAMGVEAGLRTRAKTNSGFAVDEAYSSTRGESGVCGA